MLVIGSAALAAHGIDLGRKLGDIDFICTPESYRILAAGFGDRVLVDNETSAKSRALHVLGYRPIDIEIAEPGTAAAEILTLGRDLGLISELLVPGLNASAPCAAPDLVYALKMSHRYLRNNPHFRKTRTDILRLREVGCTIPEALKPWYSKRVKETYWYKHPNLNQQSKSFFSDDAVPYVYDHDTVHEAVKTHDRPAFEYIKADTAEVFCSKEKFLEAPEHIRLATVLEESYVLAIERHQVPNDFRPPRERSFLIALEKVCTSIASGWWREYAWENYDAVRKLYDDSYVDRFHEGLASGLVQPYRSVDENSVAFSS
jgi:hypothetical protein